MRVVADAYCKPEACAGMNCKVNERESERECWGFCCAGVVKGKLQQERGRFCLQLEAGLILRSKRWPSRCVGWFYKAVMCNKQGESSWWKRFGLG